MILQFQQKIYTQSQKKRATFTPASSSSYLENGSFEVKTRPRSGSEVAFLLPKTWRDINHQQSQIGWLLKSKANESYCLYNSGPMVRHYALSRQLDLGGSQRSPERSKVMHPSWLGLSTYLGAYGSHSQGHSVEPLVLSLFIDKQLARKLRHLLTVCPAKARNDV